MKKLHWSVFMSLSLLLFQILVLILILLKNNYWGVRLTIPFIVSWGLHPIIYVIALVIEIARKLSQPKSHSAVTEILLAIIIAFPIGVANLLIGPLIPFRGVDNSTHFNGQFYFITEYYLGGGYGAELYQCNFFRFGCEPIEMDHPKTFRQTGNNLQVLDSNGQVVYTIDK